MRLRVAVDWAGDVIDDRVHDGHTLRVGAAGDDDVSIPGDATAPIRFMQVGALVVAAIPASLVAAIEWPDGVCEAVAHDTELTLAGAHAAGRLLLRCSPLPEHVTSVRFSVEPALPARRDVALVGWAAGALSLASFLAMGLSFTSSALSPTLAGPHALGEGEAALLRVSFIPDSRHELQPLDDRHSGLGGVGRGGDHPREGVGDPSRYAQLLVEGFERYLSNDLAGARASWNEAADFAPDRPEAWVNLAQVEKREGATAPWAQRMEALERERALLQHALATAPQHCEALVNLGLVEARTSRPAAARAIIDRARLACGARSAFVSLDEAALAAAENQPQRTLAAIEEAAAALRIDTADKRREALTDLEHDPLFLTVRGDPRFRAVIAQLRRSLGAQAPV
jgi:hypothetical protein